MYVIDVNKDGRSDVVTSMAHSYGVLWFEQTADGQWMRRMIDSTWANAHSSAMADLNGDGQLDLVAAKRYFGRTGNDPAEREPMGIYWYQFRPGPKDSVEWIRHIVDYGGRAGGGLQMIVEDMDNDGDRDVVAAGKTGCLSVRESHQGSKEPGVLLMSDSIRFYDRALQRLTRRELLNIAWKLGLAAVAQPLVIDDARSRSRSSGPSRSPSASRRASPGLTAWCCGRASRPSRSRAAACPWRTSTSPGKWRRIARSPRSRREGRPWRGPSSGTACASRSAGSSPGANTSIGFASVARSARSGGPRPRRRSARPSIACASPSAAAATTRRGTSPRSGRLADEELDFVFHTGDYIYEGRDDGGKTPAVVRQHQGDEIYTLVDYRNRYAQYKMDPDLRAAHASAPFVVTWDDHEVDNDYAGDRDENGTPPEVFLLRRAAAYQAYFESMPLRASVIPSGPNMRLYRRLQFGNLLDLSVLDTRQFRARSRRAA